jgi:hypothetical protein
MDIALKYQYLPSNVPICPQISVFAPEFNFQYIRAVVSVKDYMSKYMAEKMVHKDMHKIIFQSN